MPNRFLRFVFAVAALPTAFAAFAAFAAESGPLSSYARRFTPATPPGFDCAEAGSAVQDAICASDALAALDQETAQVFRANLRSADVFGRDQLLAGQRRWLLGRAGRCAVPAARLQAAPEAAVVACLEADYRERLAALRAWQPARRSAAADSDHPLSAYVQFRTAEATDATLCERMRGQINAAIKRDGEINPARIPGARLIAGSHGAAEAESVAVVQRDAGPYGSYEMRATGLRLGGGLALDDRALGKWISEQPNFGGRPSDFSSQTGDYGSLDVFALDARRYALVTEAWGYYTPASSGESAYAGLYALDSGAQRACLYKTYLRPPVHSPFNGLPAYAAFKDALQAIRDSEPSGLDVNDRRDEMLLQAEQEWQLLHLPMMQIIEAKQFGWSGWLRRRHDTVLDRLFAWSEGSLAAKQLYRALMPTLKPAAAELATTLRFTQGINADEAAQAADLVVMELLDHAVSAVADTSEAYALAPAALAKYKPRFPVLAERADVEKGRPVATLYGAVLNRLPAKAVADFIAWEDAHPEKRSTGRDGESPLAAAVLVADTVAQLLAAGADPNAADRYGFTPLMWAARFGQRAAAEKLLAAGARIDAVTLDLPVQGGESAELRRARIGGKPPLYFAALGGDPATVQLLLEKGAGLWQRDAYGTLPCDAMKLNPWIADDDRTALRTKLCVPEPTNLARPARESFSIERPTLHAGDRWKMTVRGLNTNVLWQTDEIAVAEVQADRIKLTINGRPGMMTAGLAMLDGPQLRCDKGFEWLSFPLTPGKQWAFTTNWEDFKAKAAGRAQMDVTVKGREKIRTPAGEVDAVKIEAQGSIRVTAPIHLTRKITVNLWYAPMLKAIVRTEWVDGATDMLIEVAESSVAP